MSRRGAACRALVFARISVAHKRFSVKRRCSAAAAACYNASSLLFLVPRLRVGTHTRTLRVHEGETVLMEKQPPDKDSKKLPVLLLLSLFIFWACFFAIFVRGMPPNGDPVNYFIVARSIAERRTVALEKNDFVPLEQGPDGAYYSKFGIGQSLLEAPFYLLGRALLPIRARDPNYAYAFTYFFSVLSVPVASALAIILFMLLIVELGGAARLAASSAFILGLTTLVWPYAREGFSEPLQMCALCGAFLFAARSRNKDSTAAAMLSGLFLGILILTKSANLIIVPFFAIYIFFAPSETSGRRAAHAVSFLIPIIIFSAFVLAYNDVRFGSPLDFGYNSGRDARFGFNVSLLSGLYGFIFSPGKSIFLYSPILLATLFGISAFHKRRKAESLLLWPVVVTLTLLYSKWWAWHGDWAWGPRFLVPIIPLLVLPLVFLLENFKNWKLAAKAAFLFLIGISFYVQILGSTVSFYEYIMVSRHQVKYDPYYMPGREDMRDDQIATHFIPDFSPIAGHAWLLKHTLNDSRLPPAEIRKRMQADFPWKNLMAYAPPPNPETAIGFDYWWRHFPRFFPESEEWMFSLVGILLICSIASLAVSLRILLKIPWFYMFTRVTMCTVPLYIFLKSLR